jgi:hypothetical protein
MYLPVCGFAAHSFSGAVDFNCDGSIEPDVAANLDPEAPGPANTTDVDAPYEDWHSLVLKGGAIGGSGLEALLPDSTPDDEADSTELQAVAAGRAAAGRHHARGRQRDRHERERASDRAASRARRQVAFQYTPSGDYDTASETGFTDAGAGADAVAGDATLTGLTPGTTYHFRAVAVGPDAQSQGADLTFTTAAAPATGTPQSPNAPASNPTPPAVTVHPVLAPGALKLAGPMRLDGHGRLLVALECKLGGGSCTGTVAVSVPRRHRTRRVAFRKLALVSGKTVVLVVRLAPADARTLRQGARVLLTATLRSGPKLTVSARPVKTKHKWRSLNRECALSRPVGPPGGSPRTRRPGTYPRAPIAGPLPAAAVRGMGGCVNTGPDGQVRLR